MNMPLVLLNRRRRGFTAFSPASLFSSTAIGIWLDPSDLSTMFSDRAGTTPVTTPGTVVGLRLDKSKGLVLGSEIVVNGNFATDTDWVKGAGWTISGGVASYDGTDSPNAIYQTAAALASGKFYRVSITVSLTQGALLVRPAYTAVAGQYQINSSGTYSILLSGQGGQFGLTAGNAGGRFIGSIDNISVRELAGNHAVAPTDAARPIYGVEPKGGRRNLLTYSEQFNAASWLVFGGASKTGTDIAVAPDGTTTADSIRVTTAGTGSNVYQNQTYTVSAVPYTFSCWVKRNAASDQTFQLFNNLQGAQVSSGNLTATDTWQRFSLTSTSNAGSGVMLIGIIGNTSGAQADLLVWGAQLELGSTETNYQRVTTAYDITESGVPTCHYVQYDGSDDSMSTAAIDFTSTDKMSVFAGVRKLSDAAVIIAELGTDFNSQAGSMLLANGTPVGSGPNYCSGSRGTAAASTGQIGNSAASFAAPITSLVTALHDIAGDLSAIRVNGVASGTNATGDKGAGNFGNHSLFFGRRNNATAPFNGRDFGLIIVGKAASAGEITDTETWLAAKTAQVTL